MDLKRFLTVSVLLLFAATSHGAVGLKPGPQLWIYSIKGDTSSINKLVKEHSFDKAILGRALYHTIRRSKNPNSPELLEAAATLIKYGADVNFQTMNGRSPLIAATRKKSPKLVTLLLENNADLSLGDATGKTAMDHALSKEVKDILSNPPAAKPMELAKIEPKIVNPDLFMEDDLVKVTYDLVAPDPVCVYLVGSLNGGESYEMAFNYVEGEINGEIAPGEGKYAAWQYLSDYPEGLDNYDVLIDIVIQPCR